MLSIISFVSQPRFSAVHHGALKALCELVKRITLCVTVISLHRLRRSPKPIALQFTAPDLSAIALDLDELEESFDEGRQGKASANMDDTGFFSVQVIENALKVWGLRSALLTRQAIMI